MQHRRVQTPFPTLGYPQCPVTGQHVTAVREKGEGCTNNSSSVSYLERSRKLTYGSVASSHHALIMGNFWMGPCSLTCTVCKASSRSWWVDSANQELCTEVWKFPQKHFFYSRTCTLHITKQDRIHIFHIFKSCIKQILTRRCHIHSFRRGNPGSCIAWYRYGPPPMQTGTTSWPLPGTKPWRIPKSH